MSDSIEMQENTQSQVTESADAKTSAVETPATDVQAAASDSNRPEVSEASPQPPATRPVESQESEELVDQGAVDPSSVSASECSCGGGAPPQLVFAIGQLGFDFRTEARRDSIMQHMEPPGSPHDPGKLLAHLKKSPSDAASITWTLNLDATPIYAVQTVGAFASDIYQQLRDFLGEQIKGEVERVSIPGYISGNARLFSGEVVPTIWPELRGMYSWNTAALVKAVCGPSPPGNASQKVKDEYAQKAQSLANFLLRVYDELRNLGITPQERSINYAATNAFLVAKVFEDAIKEGMDLDTIEVERSPICRQYSDCWDVKLTFFNPSKVFEQARKVYRFTVDVSDVVPVMVGPVRSRFVR